MREQDTRYRIRKNTLKSLASCIGYHVSKPLNEKGIALVMVLILSAISLAIMAGLIYMVTSGTQISGIEKRYKTALEAGIASKEVTYQFIGMRDDPGILNINFLFSSNFSTNCRTAKLNTPASTTNWASCGTGGNYTKTTSFSIDPNDPVTYDMSLDLGTSPNPTYRVYSKIVDTVEGNSSGELGLSKGGVVLANTGEITVMNIPYLYTIEIDAENAANPAERAKLSILYQY